MKKLDWKTLLNSIILSVIITITGCAHPQTKTLDTFIVPPDKVRHFTISANLTATSFIALREQKNLSKNDALLLSSLGTLFIGVAKEIYDLKRKNDFSIEDILWDTLGISAGIIAGNKFSTK